MTPGYRFYQSSYDRDEKGSVLSVNYDGLGTTVTYIGYFLLFLGILLSMLNKNTNVISFLTDAGALSSFGCDTGPSRPASDRFFY